MKVKEYLEKVKSTQFTFIKARARKDANTPFYHAEYQTTPILSRWDLEESKLLDYIILNNKQAPIDWLSGAQWGAQFNVGWLESLLVISDDDFALLYESEKQRKGMINFIDNQIKESLK